MMSKKWSFALLLSLLLSIAPASGLLAQSTPLSSSFTYQGYLSDINGPISAACDFQFGLFTAVSAGTQVGSTQTKTNVAVNGGVFTVSLDFGATAFNSTDRYLDIQVRCPTGVGTYATLTPRQPITAAPYALGLYGLQVQQNATSPNLIGGFSGNSVTPGVVGAVISGGGLETNSNIVTDNHGFVGGGGANRAGNNTGTTSDAGFATVGGGGANTASGSFATIGGGSINYATNNYTTVGGGYGNQAEGLNAVVGGGLENTAQGTRSTVAGGEFNIATGIVGTVGGGSQNNANGQGATVTGGLLNTASDEYATIGGGFTNTASGGAATIAGGYENSASGIESTVGGGYSNSATATTATIAGGYDNTASGFAAMIPGGRLNIASGDYSFAAGRRANAAHNGAFVWADSTDADFSSNLANQFFVRATGGTVFYSSSNLSTGVVLNAGSGSWSAVSDQNVKSNFQAVDAQMVLQGVINLPLSTWNYSAQDSSIRHIGPMAQDFYAAFGVGEDDRHISMVDSDGVALAAIQGLYQVVQDKDAQITSLQTENETLKTRLDDLDQRLASLEALASPTQAGIASPFMLMVLAAGGLGLYGWRVTRKETGA